MSTTMEDVRRDEAMRDLRTGVTILTRLGVTFRELVMLIESIVSEEERMLVRRRTNALALLSQHVGEQPGLCACGTGLPHAECCRLGHRRNGGLT